LIAIQVNQRGLKTACSVSCNAILRSATWLDFSNISACAEEHFTAGFE
jgi:hypothetical protein